MTFEERKLFSELLETNRKLLQEVNRMANLLSDVISVQGQTLAAIKNIPAQAAPLPAGSVVVAQADIDTAMANEQANLAAAQVLAAPPAATQA